MKKIKTPSDAASVLPPSLRRRQREHFYVIALNAASHPIAVQCVAKGFIDSCAVDPREVFRFALIKRAAALVLAHNHPSGDVTPSSADIDLTRRLRDGAKLLGIRILDHVIVSREHTLSMLEAGYIDSAQTPHQQHDNRAQGAA